MLYLVYTKGYFQELELQFIGMHCLTALTLSCITTSSRLPTVSCDSIGVILCTWAWPTQWLALRRRPWTTHWTSSRRASRPARATPCGSSCQLRRSLPSPEALSPGRWFNLIHYAWKFNLFLYCGYVLLLSVMEFLDYISASSKRLGYISMCGRSMGSHTRWSERCLNKLSMLTCSLELGNILVLPGNRCRHAFLYCALMSKRSLI